MLSCFSGLVTVLVQALYQETTTMSYQIDLSGRVAFVTGASSGLGAQFAKTLAAAGATFSPEVHQAAAVLTFLSPGLRFFHQGQFFSALA